MVQKELYARLIDHNLIRCVMAQAAAPECARPRCSL